jgi:endogenous inhibitor of DNA gyrase (YacG/DUF329 family)
MAPSRQGPLPPHTYPCPQCRRPYRNTLMYWTFCSDACRAEWLARHPLPEATAVDDVERVAADLEELLGRKIRPSNSVTD